MTVAKIISVILALSLSKGKNPRISFEAPQLAGCPILRVLCEGWEVQTSPHLKSVILSEAEGPAVCLDQHNLGLAII